MAARAAELGDVGESSPEHWEKPLGTADVHVALAALSPDAARLEAVAERARRAHEELAGRRGDLAPGLLPAADRAHLVRLQGRDRPAGGRGQRHAAARTRSERPLKAGEIILGYPDETGELPPMPTPDVLGRNGTYVVFRKLHTRVAAYRQYLRAKAASREEEALLGAKMVGRWQSGAPLALVPGARRPRRSAPTRSATTTSSTATICAGFKCPAGAHARRANPRDALDDEGSVDVRLHRMIRRGTSYGPMLPEGVLEDDGADRGIIFVFAGAHLEAPVRVRQDPVAQRRHLHRRPGREGPARRAERRLRHASRSRSGRSGAGCRTLPPFVVTRGGEYCFAPGLRAMRWLAELDT